MYVCMYVCMKAFIASCMYSTWHAQISVRNMYKVSIIRPWGRMTIILSNESTFTTKHLNRVPVKTDGQGFLSWRKIHRNDPWFFSIKRNVKNKHLYKAILPCLFSLEIQWRSSWTRKTKKKAVKVENSMPW